MLLNPNHLQRRYPDRRSAEIMSATVDFFESRGKARVYSAVQGVQDFGAIEGDREDRALARDLDLGHAPTITPI